MLDHAVRSLKAGASRPVAAFAVTTEVTCISRRCSATYCADVHERLVLYKRFANCASAEQLERCRKSWSIASATCRARARADREPRLRILGRALGVARVDAAPKRSSPVRAHLPSIPRRVETRAETARLETHPPNSCASSA